MASEAHNQQQSWSSNSADVGYNIRKLMCTIISNAEQSVAASTTVNGHENTNPVKDNIFHISNANNEIQINGFTRCNDSQDTDNGQQELSTAPDPQRQNFDNCQQTQQQESSVDTDHRCENPGFETDFKHQNLGFVPINEQQRSGFHPDNGHELPGVVPGYGYQNPGFVPNYGHQNLGYDQPYGHQNPGFIPSHGHQFAGIPGYIHNNQISAPTYEHANESGISDPQVIVVQPKKERQKSNLCMKVCCACCINVIEEIGSLWCLIIFIPLVLGLTYYFISTR